MTIRELTTYKRAAKQACKENGIKVNMIDMTLLETGITAGTVDYVLFTDNKSGKTYSCVSNVNYYSDEVPSYWKVCEYVEEEEAQEEQPIENATTNTEHDTQFARRRYYVVRGRFANVYNLYYADSAVMAACLPENAERITRAVAIDLCQRERFRRKYDQGFSGYADIAIYPADWEFGEQIVDSREHWKNGYIWEKVETW